MRRVPFLALALALVAAPTAQAQTAAQLVDRGVAAYQDLDLSAAAGLFRRALSLTGSDTLALRDRLRALSYLGAAEFLRDNRDSTIAAFRGIVLLSPRHRLDDLVFPPEITALFGEVARQTKVVQVRLPPAVRFRAGEVGFRPQLVASSFHQIVVAVDRGDGTPARLLFQGLIGDSLEVLWDGLDSAGVPVSSARYFLRVESRGASGQPERVVRVPLEIRTADADTLPHPILAESVLLPERSPTGRNVQALFGGVVGGIGLAVLPSLLASDAELSPGRFVVAGSVTMAGLVAFFTQRGGTPIPENVAANEAQRQAWRGELDRVTQENARRRAAVDLTVQVGPPAVVDLQRP
ncbi:MAG: hypothetical protein IH616_06430 [Gemmatimonadales bacterium]|nr:hypothetical protein [Gemmatimonadales bacterium]